MTFNAMNTLNTINNTFLVDVNQTNAIIKNQSKHAQSDFTAAFKMALDHISQTQIQAHNQAQAFEQGKPNITLNEVMVNMQKSSVSLQFGIQVRNKLIGAYQEIMNMNV